ncbi:MAG: hypothetical protein C4532_09890 [Candidatus Abyssobacteria bacterium SURF_17]|uniref:Glycosyltransferase RgtA/B/C/D-like domain-containing protein n=1 Tax=Candidatus Abyssobacteria bacterium SURF_17 TaxID=2093361 RepID=A0A419EYF8_9BACT|nr:MAG: hypothetical protein C4532_09890 [Candidatus Abyssubacteria bacterium SURF_17]
MHRRRDSTLSFSLLFILITGLGLILRLYRLAANQLWLDEVHSIFVAGSSLSDILNNLKNDGHPPLYFILMLAWKSAFGESELSVRALSVMLGMASLVAVCWLGSILVSKRIGLTGMFIASITPLHIYYSQEARMYILLALLTTLSAGFLWLALEHPARKRYWGAYALVSICMIYTHVLGWFVLPVGILFALLRKRSRQDVSRLLVYQGLVVIAFLPWAPLAIRQTEQAGQWVHQWWASTPPLLAIPRALECLGMGGSYPPYLRFSHVSPVRPISYIVFTLVGVIALVGYRDGSVSKGSRGMGAARLYLLLNLFVPIALPYAISFIKPIYLVGRSDLFVQPFYALLIAIGLMKMARFAWVGIAAVSLLACFSLSRYYTIPTAAVDKETVHHLATAAEKNDVVVVTGLRLLPIEYYLRRSGLSFQIIAYPDSMREHPGWLDYRQTDDELTQDAVSVAVASITQTRPGRPVWLLVLPFDSLNQIPSDRFELPLLEQFERHFMILSADENLGIIRFKQK